MRRCVVLTILLLAGCTARPAFELPVPPPAPPVETWIRISKTMRTLAVYEGDRLVKEYPIVLGGDPYWAKLYEGDLRTPEGDYHIVSKYFHPSWSRFMLLDYPNERNRAIYDWSLEHDLIPRDGGMPAGIGGAIGIHGTRDDDLNRRGVNWTLGCISLLNRDVDELYDRVPIGTRVFIER